MRQALTFVLLTVVAVVVSTAIDGGHAAAVDRAGVDFSIGIDTNGDGVDDCDTRGGAPTCSISVYGRFDVKIRLDEFPGDLAGYDSFEVLLEQTGMAHVGGDVSWPDGVCFTDAQDRPDRPAKFGCLSMDPDLISTYTGLMATFSFLCRQNGVVVLAEAALGQLGYEEPFGPADALAIDCVAPPAAGDANCNGIANSVDASLVLQIDARLSHNIGCKHLANVLPGKQVNAEDAAVILQYEAGLLMDLPPIPDTILNDLLRLANTQLGVPASVIAKEAAAWPDSCLGLPSSGGCTLAIEFGWRIVLGGGGRLAIWHVTTRGDMRLAWSGAAK